MRNQKSKRKELFTVDLSRIEGNGDFKCPKCSTKISPDDMTEESFTILDTIMKKGQIDRIVLKCNACGIQINLTGFKLLTNSGW
ncbi:MAG: hypothetical protein JSV64_03460 [Candidatus Bathyarchaeota archaeon]|jgi:predicted RNA-binding Zn-ribbon protein involved in translation (DUF1610 family)|nr:MAG: hypothetical protein JSV64_03460 [Candidatus Bathyarchaeota archaeon]